ncbi:MAG: hypothetical protein M1275_00505 [Patescibacteria group bacterium]|nr:hypothetical protein [Patescibacteria group bacterium]
MRELFFEAIGEAENLEEVYKGLLSVLNQLNRRRDMRIGYVAGIITSEGLEHAEKNFKRLDRFTSALRERRGFPMISAPEVFDGEVFVRQRASRPGYGKEDFLRFWRSVLASGHVTDVFFTPRWEESAGSIDEFKTAKALNLRIHFVDKDLF